MKKNIFTKDNLMFFIILNLGLIFTAVGIAIFKTPNHFAFGGTSGLSIILSTLFPKWNVGAFMWIVNAALVVLGFFFLGIRSMGWTVYSSFALSFYVSACEAIYPLSSPLTHDVFLELCFAVRKSVHLARRAAVLQQNITVSCIPAMISMRLKRRF